jgi:hypothetical protein
MAKRKRKHRNKPKVQLPKPEFPAFEAPLSSPVSKSESSEPESPLSPAEKRWLEFEAADYEGQLALCHQTIEEETLMDEENAFEMFNTLYYKTVEHNERHHFEELANKLRERLPDIFAKEAQYILDWQITNALAEGRLDDVLPLAQELARTGGENLDMFVRTLNMLDYHGQLPALLEIMPVAWPDVKHGEDYFDWAIDEFASRASDYIIFDYLERDPSLQAENPELQEKLGFYLESINQETLARFLDRLTGRAEQTWRMSDFGFTRQPQGKRRAMKPVKTDQLSEEAKQNIYDLTIEFLRYLRHKQDVPYTKGRLAQRQIYEYLLERHAGELKPQESMFEAVMRGPRERRPKPKMRYPDHWLCPDRSTLDRFLARLLGFLSGRYHEATVTFELIPAWLGFLESRQLIDAEQRAKTLQDLRGLDTEFFKVVEDHSDPALARAITRWREEQ